MTSLLLDGYHNTNYTEDKGGEISDIKLTYDVVNTTTDISPSLSIQDTQQVMHQDDLLQKLKEYIIQRWPASRNRISQEM